MDVLKFFGSEEGQRIQGESGAAIPAYEGLEETWISAFDQFDYQLNVQAFHRHVRLLRAVASTTPPVPSGRAGQ